MIDIILNILYIALVYCILCLIRTTMIHEFNKKFAKDNSISVEEFNHIIEFTYGLVCKIWIWNFNSYFNKNYKKGG